MAAPKKARRMEAGRLTYYMEPADDTFWDERWDRADITKKLFEDARRYGSLPILDRLYKKYIPREGLLLEAGCGVGSTVAAFQGMGYDIEGVDYAQKTINRILAADPDMPVRVGDVLALDVPDNTYTAYLSYGVVEHRQAGPEPFLREAYRVVKPGGWAFISVPYLNPVRRLKSLLGLYRGKPGDLEFYQYAFPRGDFESQLRAVGFEIVDWTAYDSRKAFKDELPFLRRLYKIPKLGWRLQRLLEKNPTVEKHFGHMLMVIARKPQS